MTTIDRLCAEHYLRVSEALIPIIYPSLLDENSKVSGPQWKFTLVAGYAKDLVKATRIQLELMLNEYQEQESGS